MKHLVTRRLAAAVGLALAGLAALFSYLINS